MNQHAEIHVGPGTRPTRTSELLREFAHSLNSDRVTLAEIVSAIERQVRNTQAFCRRAAEAQFFQLGCPMQYDRPLPPVSN